MSLIRATESYRKTGPPGTATYETYTVAPEKELEGSRFTRKGDPYPQVTPSSAKVMTIGRKCSSRSTTTLRCALPIFTDVSKEGWGAHLGEHTIRGTCSLPESRLHLVYCGRIWILMPSHQWPSWAKCWRSFRTICARESFRLLQGGPPCPGFRT